MSLEISLNSFSEAKLPSFHLLRNLNVMKYFVFVFEFEFECLVITQVNESSIFVSV